MRLRWRKRELSRGRGFIRSESADARGVTSFAVKSPDRAPCGDRPHRERKLAEEHELVSGKPVNNEKCLRWVASLIVQIAPGIIVGSCDHQNESPPFKDNLPTVPPRGVFIHLSSFGGSRVRTYEAN